MTTDTVTDGRLLYYSANNWRGDVVIVQRLDGPVLWAFQDTAGRTGTCSFMGVSIADGHFAITIRDSLTIGVAGTFRSSLDDREPSSSWWVANSDTGTGGYYASRDWLFRRRVGAVVGQAWSGGTEFVVTSAETDSDGMTQIPLAAFSLDGAFVVPVNLGVSYDAIVVWDQAHGLRPFLRWPLADHVGASNIASDGHQLVWSQATGWSTDPNRSWDYAQSYLMTAPATTDPEELRRTARQVSEEIEGHQVGLEYNVGCGYALRVTGSSKLVVVRTADGATWVFPKLPRPAAWREGLGATCDDIFVYGYHGPDENSLKGFIARIPIASLGPPNGG